MSNQRPTVAIIYGFCEGKRLAGKLKKAIVAGGYALAPNARDADIVIAHSGGCFLVPDDTRASLVVLIGLTFWPGKTLGSRARQKLRMEYDLFRGEGQLGAWLIKTLWNGFYFWNIRRDLVMQRRLRTYDMHGLQGRTVVHIRNEDDAFCSPQITTAPFLSDAHFVTVSGQHDDWWIHPERYIDVISQYWHTAAE